MTEQNNTYKLGISEIKQMVSECIKKIISEGMSKLTYHFASLDSCVKILSKNEFHLTMSSNKADAKDNKRFFYLSTQRSRSKSISYARKFGSCVRIQLDGDALGYNYKGKPMDYWQYKQKYYDPEYNDVFGKGFTKSRREHQDFEMEDRVFSYKPVIKNANKYITRIDVYLDSSRENTIERERDMATTIYMLGRRLKINVFVYNDLNAFNSMSEKNINTEIENEYNSGSQPYIDNSYTNSERYKVLNGFRKTNTYVTILEHLFNILTHGKIYKKDKEAFDTISSILKQFGLEQYKGDLINQIRHSYGTSFIESCELLTSTTNAPIRKLNSIEYPDDNDSTKIMELGAYVLKKFGVSNFDDLKNVYL